jgi:hypothetical protein
MPQAGALRVDSPPPPVPLRIGPAGRHLVDLTLFFAPTSGGVRRYLLAKHEWLTRRIYTDGEGEFSRLDFEAAKTRILRGLVVLRSAGWNPTGFVAPAWLMSTSALCALEETPLQYCAACDTVVVLKSGHTVPAPSRVVRAALHPADLRYPAIERLWRALLSQLNSRRVVTECQLVPHPPMRDAHRESGGQTIALTTKQA